MRTTICRSKRVMPLVLSASAAMLMATAAWAQGPTMASSVSEARPTMHIGEFYAAPYIGRDGGPRGAGVLVGTSEVSRIIEASDRAHYELDEDVYITLPDGVTPTVGQRFYTYTLAQSFGDRGQIVIPTGIVVVRHVGDSGDATTVRIVQEFQPVKRGQSVLPLDTLTLPAVSPAPTDAGVHASVVWVENESVMPTVQYYVVLDAGEPQGVHIGDKFTLYHPATPDPEHNTVLPATDIGVAQVVRVNEYGSTALVLSETQPAIRPGNAARVTAKMP
jgi:hypothetical protein